MGCGGSVPAQALPTMQALPRDRESARPRTAETCEDAEPAAIAATSWDQESVDFCEEPQDDPACAEILGDSRPPAAEPPAPGVVPAPGGELMAALPTDVAVAILAHCPWAARAQLLLLNQHWARAVFGSNAVWRAMCELLHRDDLVYVPSVCLARGESAIK